MKNVVSSLENFIVNFEVTRLVDGTSVTEKIYRNQLYDLQLTEGYIFEVQGRHLKEHDRELYYQFIYFPA